MLSQQRFMRIEGKFKVGAVPMNVHVTYLNTLRMVVINPGGRVNSLHTCFCRLLVPTLQNQVLPGIPS